MHHKENICSPILRAREILSRLAATDSFRHLYPTKIDGITFLSKTFRMLRQNLSGRTHNGGWGDPRDRVLCRSLSEGQWFLVVDDDGINQGPVYVMSQQDKSRSSLHRKDENFASLSVLDPLIVNASLYPVF
ncbi:unnamed protein product [Protopolystoma xenopodis]|uniref:Uncharacterized protein n=1 Tax=Protopolystoma xenopodis TaxID=117903 RepID=A0A3S4ZZF0_9PLAT|nr:unnamed protein product [Protopolystoma xenopodis]